MHLEALQPRAAARPYPLRKPGVLKACAPYARDEARAISGGGFYRLLETLWLGCVLAMVAGTVPLILLLHH